MNSKSFGNFPVLFFCWLMTAFVAGAAENTTDGTGSANLAGSYQIRNVKFHDLLRPENANSAEGTRIVLHSAAPWKCMTWRLKPAGESVFQLQNHFTSKTFIIRQGDDHKSIVQIALAKKSSERPVWRFTKLSDGNYEITDVKSGDVLTAIEEGNSVQVIAAKWENKPEQQWHLEAIDPSSLTM